MKPNGRGFSLIELVLAIALLSSLVVAGIVSLRSAEVKNQSKAAAEILAEGLRLANLKARAQGYPVGVGIPSNLGSTPLARGYYYAAGEFAPPHTVGYDYGAELREALIFSGRYAGPSWTPPLATLSRGNQFDFQDWQPPYPDDTYVVFLPTGEVVANHSAANGGYRLVVGSRATYTQPAPSPDPGLAPESNLTAISDPFTVTISTQGQVEVVPGLLNGEGSLVKPSRTLPVPGQVALTPGIERTANRPPELVDPKLIIEPAPDRETIPVVVPIGNPAVTVRPDDTVALTFFARDPDGDQLTASWEATCLNKPDLSGGKWTVPSTRMRWDYAKKAWYRKGIWTPPAEALPNDRFRLYCHIDDGRGGELTPSASTAIGYPGASVDGVDVTIIPTLRLAYKDGGGGLSVANFDGSGTTSVLPGASLKAGTPSDMSWSTSRHGLLYRNGQKPYFLSQLNGSNPGVVGNGTVFGANLKGLTIQGDKLYGVLDAGGSFKLQRMPAPPVSGNQSVTDVLTISGTGTLDGLISSSAQKALISSDGAGKFALVWLKPATPSLTVTSGPALRSICLSPDNTILYGLAADGSIQSCPIDLNGNNQTVTLHPAAAEVLVPGPGNRLPSLSPNGSFLVYQDSSGNAQLLNLSKRQTAPLDVRNYSDMIWSQE